MNDILLRNLVVANSRGRPHSNRYRGRQEANRR